MIKGERISLRPIEREDLVRYVRWINDREVTTYLYTFLPMNIEDEEEWYERQRKDETSLNLAIVLNIGAKHIGSIGLHKINYREQQAELGIMIGDKGEWGQGYGREAIELLLEFAFTELNFHRIYLQVFAEHAAAQRCYRHCGFQEEGRLRDATFRRGRFQDMLIMSVLRPEYLQQREEVGQNVRGDDSI